VSHLQMQARCCRSLMVCVLTDGVRDTTPLKLQPPQTCCCRYLLRACTLPAPRHLCACVLCHPLRPPTVGGFADVVSDQGVGEPPSAGDEPGTPRMTPGAKPSVYAGILPRDDGRYHCPFLTCGSSYTAVVRAMMAFLSAPSPLLIASCHLRTDSIFHWRTPTHQL